MKKILIIAYYYPPCIGIAANRPAAFANDFSSNHQVKVVTRHWNGNEDSWTDYLTSVERPIEKEEVNENLEVIRLPFISKIKRPNKLKTFFHLFNGPLDQEIDGLQLYEYADQLTAEWKPDVILLSAPPKNLLRVGRLLHEKHAVPFIADFRDFQNHIVLRPERKKGLKEWIHFRLILQQVKKDLRSVTAITGVNSEICQFFYQETKKPCKIIYNGYEESIFKDFVPIEELVLDYFSVSIIGTVYENQDLSIFLNAFRQIIDKHPELRIRFNFIGTDTIPEIGQQIRKAIPEKYLMLTKKISRIRALEHLEKSHLVWQPEMVGYKGVYSGKIFEYLGAKRPIMVAPSIGDVLDKLLQETNSGQSFKTSIEIADYILTQYHLWKKNGSIQYQGDEEKIKFYSRENQSKQLIEWIQELI